MSERGREREREGGGGGVGRNLSPLSKAFESLNNTTFMYVLFVNTAFFVSSSLAY